MISFVLFFKYFMCLLSKLIFKRISLTDFQPCNLKFQYRWIFPHWSFKIKIIIHDKSSWWLHRRFASEKLSIFQVFSVKCTKYRVSFLLELQARSPSIIIVNRTSINYQHIFRTSPFLKEITNQRFMRNMRVFTIVLRNSECGSVPFILAFSMAGIKFVLV